MLVSCESTGPRFVPFPCPDVFTQCCCRLRRTSRARATWRSQRVPRPPRSWCSSTHSRLACEELLLAPAAVRVCAERVRGPGVAGHPRWHLFLQAVTPKLPGGALVGADGRLAQPWGTGPCHRAEVCGGLYLPGLCECLCVLTRQALPTRHFSKCVPIVRRHDCTRSPS